MVSDNLNGDFILKHQSTVCLDKCIQTCIEMYLLWSEKV